MYLIHLSKHLSRLSIHTFLMALIALGIQCFGIQAAHADDTYLLSLNRPVYASSMNGMNTPDLTVDGDLNSRWESVWQKDPQWLYVDLGAKANVSRVFINWENAYATAFQIQVSDDQINWTSIYSTSSNSSLISDVNISATGRYLRVYCTERATGYGYSIRELNVFGTGGINAPVPSTPNIALNKPVTVSSQENQQPGTGYLQPNDYLSSNATDGDPATRWSSIHADTEWMYVDLGQPYTIGRLVLTWENAFGRAYDIQVSNDAQSWTTVYRQLKGNGGKETIPLYVNGRYVRLYGIARGSGYGYSLFEFEVHPYQVGDPQPAYTIPAIPTASSVSVGLGSYEINDITQLEPKFPNNRTANVNSPIPSNDWWQSILISHLGNSSSLITLPLKNKYTKLGLALLNPGAGFTTTGGGSIDTDDNPDFYLMPNTINSAAMESKVSGYGDYSVNVILSDDTTAKMSTTFVKGSPFVYNTFDHPDIINLTSQVPTRIFDDSNSTILSNDFDNFSGDHIGFEVTNTSNDPAKPTVTRSYGIYAPAGSTFFKVGNTLQIKLGSGQNFLSVAALPSNSDLFYFYQHAYAFVTGTKVSYSYDQSSSIVTTDFKSTTTLMRSGFSSDTVMLLLPHQWKISSTALTALTYPSIRGTLKVREGNTFTTVNRFYGILPQFAEPSNPAYSRAQVSAYLDLLDTSLSGGLMSLDPYWQGKSLHPLAEAILICDQISDYSRRDQYVATLKTILTDWYSYSSTEAPYSYYLHYSPDWGSVFSYNSGFGLNTGLTDHHFTYGYYVFASAVLATYDKDFLNNYGGMVEVLLRDYANPSRTDSQFPWFRNFDPYEGHSWAGGYADNRSGNNQEAAGESLIGWVGEFLWGVATANPIYRDAGIWGFTTEEKAIEQYWFNYDHDNWPSDYAHGVVGQVYGSAYTYGTFFSGNPQHIYGIHWLPTSEWLTYYGRVPSKTGDLYNALVQDNGGPEDTWQHIIWPFQSLSDAQGVLNKWDASAMQQNEIFNSYWFVHSMASLGNRSTDIWSDWPTSTIYKNGAQYTAQIWNPTANSVTAQFRNLGGITGSTTVPPKSLVSVDPMQVTNVTLNSNSAAATTPYLDRTGWSVTTFASAGGEPGTNMLDSKLNTRWSSGTPQAPGQWIIIDMGTAQTFNTIFMSSGFSYGDYAHGYQVFVSNDGNTWGSAIANGTANSQSIAIGFASQTARYVKVIQTGTASNWWSISEFKAANYGTSGSSYTATPVAGALDRSSWVLTTSNSFGADTPANMLDGNAITRWTSGIPQAPGQWIQIDLGSAKAFDTLVMDSGGNRNDYAHAYQIMVSNDGNTWSNPIATDTGNNPINTVTFPSQTARYIKILQTGTSSSWWSIVELNVANNGTGAITAIDRTGWIMSASDNNESASNMLDSSIDSRWTSGRSQYSPSTQWIQIDMGAAKTIDTLVMDSGGNQNDYAHGYQVFVSIDGINWGNAVAAGTGNSQILTISFPQQTARYIKVLQTGTASSWWSIVELNAASNGATLDRAGWSATSSDGNEGASYMLDGDMMSRWTSGVPQSNGQWIQLDMGRTQPFKQISMNSDTNIGDYAHAYQVLVSNDGVTWGNAVASGTGNSQNLMVSFPSQTARYIKVLQTGAAPNWWSIVEFNVYQ